MYDILENGVLDIFTLREVLKKAFVNQIIQLEQAIALVKDKKDLQYQEGWTFEEFEEFVLPLLQNSLPLA